MVSPPGIPTMWSSGMPSALAIARRTRSAASMACPRWHSHAARLCWTRGCGSPN